MPTPRHYPTLQKARIPVVDGEMRQRSASARAGSEQLLAAIEALVARTAKRIDVPAQWQQQPIAFARAYLGMEIGARGLDQAIGH